MDFSRNPGEQADRMDSQPSLFGEKALGPSPQSEVAEPEKTGGISPAPPLTGFRLWAERIFLVVYVVFCIELGMLLAVLPWTRIWTDNNLLNAYPWLHSILQGNFARGIITGIGLVDIWLGVWEAVHYHEAKPDPTSPSPSV